MYNKTSNNIHPVINMIPEQRRQKILEKLNEKEICTISSLGSEFQVSRVTIQRDIKILKKQGLVLKVHGGVKMKKNKRVIETIFNERLKKNYEEKLQIAKKAQDYVSDGSTLFLDSSTTVFIFATQLFKRKFMDLNIITNSPAIVCEAVKCDTNIKIISTGGELEKDWNIFTGSWVIDFLEKINIDKAFISSAGISYDKKITTMSKSLSNILKVVIKKSNEVNLLVDSTKFLRQAMIDISDLKDFKRIITSDSFDKEAFSDFINIEGLELVL